MKVISRHSILGRIDEVLALIDISFLLKKIWIKTISVYLVHIIKRNHNSDKLTTEKIFSEGIIKCPQYFDIYRKRFDEG